jgi:putative ABC transport system substrate-binding protein
MAELGCLIGYGPSLPVLYRRAAGYTERVLKGAVPATMPIEQPMQYRPTLPPRQRRQGD